MNSAIPVHSYHPPRHPHAITPTIPHPMPPRSSTSTSCYTASSTSTQHTVYWPNHSSSYSTTSSSSPRPSASLTAAQYVTKHTTGRLHRHTRSGSKSPDLPDEMFDEGFFSGPGSPPPATDFGGRTKTRNKIKPLLKKVSVGSRNNSLDLSRSDGGLPNGVGLGIYDSQGYESSGVDDDLLETAFPKHPRKRHQRNISGLSASSTGSPLISPTQPFTHPKRQVPRQGVSALDMSRDVSSNESSDNSDDEEGIRKIVLSGSTRAVSNPHKGLSINTGFSGHSTPVATSSLTDVHAYSHHAHTSSSQLTSPVSPVSPADSFPTSTYPAKKRRGRSVIPSISKEAKEREASPSFVASVTAARLAWEAKEEKKEEKREKKRRRSEAKEGGRTESQLSHRRNNSAESITSIDEQDTAYREKLSQADDDDDVFTGRNSPHLRKPSTSSRSQGASGKRWGIPTADSEKSRKTHLGLKKRWLGFIVWVRIGMVRLGRKMGF